MLYVFRTATAGQKAFMEGLMKDVGNIRKLNEPGLFGAKTSGFSDRVLAAIKDAGIVVEKHGAWVPWLLLIFPAILALGAFEVIDFGVIFVLWGAAIVGFNYARHRATNEGGAADLGIFSSGTSDGFKWASDDSFPSQYHDNHDPSDARSASYTSYWDRY